VQQFDDSPHSNQVFAQRQPRVVFFFKSASFIGKMTEIPCQISGLGD